MTRAAVLRDPDPQPRHRSRPAMTPAPARDLHQAMRQTLDLVEYEAVKRALLDAYITASDEQRVPLSNAYVALFPRSVELTLAERPAPKDTRTCSSCGLTLPTPTRPNGIPDYWMLDPRIALLVCGKCHARRCAEGWRTPARSEINYQALADARRMLRIDGPVVG